MFYLHLPVFLKDICVCTCICVCVHVYICMFVEGGYLQRSEESTGFPGTGIKGSCELPCVGAGNRTL